MREAGVKLALGIVSDSIQENVQSARVQHNNRYNNVPAKISNVQLTIAQLTDNTILPEIVDKKQ